MRLIEGSVITLEGLRRIATKEQVKRLRDSLRIFPTPFKGVYYIPFETERKAFYITNPYKVLIEAARLILGKDVYYGLETAYYFERKIWNPVPAHIINRLRSDRLIIRQNKPAQYWRTKRRFDILRQFPYPISLHKITRPRASAASSREIQCKYKDGIPYASSDTNKKDAEYLCKKGSKSACYFLKNNNVQ